jgi:hypothetical protein
MGDELETVTGAAVIEAPLETRLETGEPPDVPSAEVAEISLGTPAFSFKGSFPDVPFAPGVNIEATDRRRLKARCTSYDH